MTDTTTARVSAVATIKDLFDDLKAAEARVKSVKSEIAAVRAALRPKANGKAKAAKTPTTKTATPKSRRRGMPAVTAAAAPAKATAADEV